LQSGLITKPTLVWKLNAQQGGEHNALVSYQTDNITWRADYSIALNKDDTAADVSSWITLVNESGASYPNARLRLVAGDVHRIETAQHRGGLLAGGRGGESPAQERPFFEYHLYTIARPTSIANNSTKQIELQAYTDRDIRDEANKKVDVYLQLKNTEKSGLGIPFPAGRIRVYKRDEPNQADADPAGSLEFIGEDKIDHTPKDEEILVRVGSAFDVTGQHKQTDFVQEGKELSESFEIKLSNHKKEPAKVLVKETLFRWSNWQITASSDKFEKHNSRTIYIPVEVGAGQEKTVTYTVKYTW
jgi:hypothetical protein